MSSSKQKARQKRKADQKKSGSSAQSAQQSKAAAGAPKQATASSTAQAAPQAASGSKAQQQPGTGIADELPFTRMNYILLALGALILLAGYFLVSVGGFVDATKFSVALHIAPWVIVAGYVEIIIAILYRPKS